jgi:hypothetical protein
MNRRISVLFLALAIPFTKPPAAIAQSATTNRINGVAEFLLERANENATAMLQRDMRASRLLKCYLPETYKSATSKNLQLLLQSGPELWKRSVEADLKNFGAHLLLNKISSGTFKTWSDGITDQYIAVLRNVTVQVDGKQYEVTSIPLTASAEVKASVNSFYPDYLKAQERIKNIVSQLEAARSSSPADCPSAPIVPALKEIAEVINNLKAQMARFQKSDVAFKAPVNLPEATFYNSLAALEVIDQRLKYYQARIDAIRREESLVVQMYKLDELIRDSIKSGENPLIAAAAAKEYDRFSRYALSLATLSEAESVGQAKAVLRQLALPPVSFTAKREVGANKVTISAYFGASGGVEVVDRASKGFGGLAVPLGLEYSRGLRNGSAGVMFAPLDFAHPINQVINARGSSAEFKDIFAPGVYLTYGFRELPLLLGAGYSRGPSLTATQGGNRGRGFMFLGMDLPLLNLY